MPVWVGMAGFGQRHTFFEAHLDHKEAGPLSIDYAFGELSAAILVLATTDTPLRERLAQAVEQLGVRSETDLPEPVRSHFDAFITRITRAATTGPIWATIRESSDAEVSALARELVALYEEAARIAHHDRT
jgi:hypothetical protein